MGIYVGEILWGILVEWMGLVLAVADAGHEECNISLNISSNTPDRFVNIYTAVHSQ